MSLFLLYFKHPDEKPKLQSKNLKEKEKRKKKEKKKK